MSLDVTSGIRRSSGHRAIRVGSPAVSLVAVTVRRRLRAIHLQHCVTLTAELIALVLRLCLGPFLIEPEVREGNEQPAERMNSTHRLTSGTLCTSVRWQPARHPLRSEERR